MKTRYLIVAGLLAGISAAGPTQTSLQDAFDEATRAFEAKDWAHAAELLSAVQSRIPEGSKRSKAVASLREGYARSQLNQGASAVLLLESGLSHLPSEPALDSDRLLALQELARIYERNFELGMAARSYRKQLSLKLDDEARRGALAGYARTAMFEEPNAAEAAASEFVNLAEGSARVKAVGLNLMGRAQLIAGDHQKAKQTLQAALAAAGGLTTRTDALDASIRADLALTGLLARDEGMAHLYLAATGAARDRGGYLPAPSQFTSLKCPNNATADDIAVVEFRLGADGKPADVRPVYSTRRRGLAGAMAAYASTLSWSPETIRQLRPLQASMARLEVHCKPDDPAMDNIWWNALPQTYWLAAKGMPRFEVESESEEQRLSATYAELASREKKYGSNSVHILPVLRLLQVSPLLSYVESIAAIDRQIRIARAANAPPAVIGDMLAHRATMGVSDPSDGQRRLAELGKTWPFTEDEESRLFLSYFITAWMPVTEGVPQELLKVTQADSLPMNHPLRRAANLRASELETRDKQKMRAYQAAAGVTDNECRHANVSVDGKAASRLFPRDALRWGFEGWGLIRLDLTPAGRVQTAKPVVHYPPLVFTRASLEAAKSLTYTIKDAAGRVNGCTGHTNVVQFKLP